MEPAKLQRYARVADVFTPGAPVSRYAIFAGRWDQVMEVVNATTNSGQHVVMYGERGVGKTSLANVLEEIFQTIDPEKFAFYRVNCNTSDDFTSLWAKIFREMGIQNSGDPTTLTPTPEDVRYHLARSPRSLIVIDELDRLEDDEALSLLADTIKSLSDHAVPSTLVLVGVADSVDELIGDHQSVERALVQVPMPRMKVEELREIIDKGLAELKMTASQSVKDRIARLSEGLPHYTHLLSLHAFQRAVVDDREVADSRDVDAAISAAVAKAQHSIKSAYQLAIRSPRPENLFAEVLLACALTSKDEMGFFTAGAVRGPLSRIMGRTYEIPAFARHLDEFTKETHGCVLAKSGVKRRQFYRFNNPLVQPYVILTGLARGRISEGALVGQSTAGDATGPERPS